MAMNKRGQTMIELVIYIAMAGLAAITIMALFNMAQRTQSSTYSSYLMSGKTEEALGRLRRELRESAMPSIVVYPNLDHPNEKPGVAFPSAYKESMAFSPYGTPSWDRHVFYTLVAPPGKSETGKVVRWEQNFANKDFLPQMPVTLPSLQTNPGSTALLNVVLPNQEVHGLKDQPGYKTDKFGGFRVQYLERTGGDAGAEGLTSQNPTSEQRLFHFALDKQRQRTLISSRGSRATKVGSKAAAKPPDAANTTSLIEVELKLLSRTSISKADFYTIRFRVHPAYPP
jgi:hypothetical protein